MSLTITQINGTDSISAGRVIINNNFQNIKDEFETLSEVIDTDKNIVANSVNIERGVRPLSEVIFDVDGSANIEGDLVVKDELIVKDLSVTANSNVNIASSTINITGASSRTNIEGTTKIKGVMSYSGYETAFDGTFINLYESNNGVYGNLKVEDKNAVILNFANYSSISEQNTIKDFGILPGVTQGQTFTLVMNTFSSSGKPHRLLNTNNNIGSLSFSQAISFNQDGCMVEFVWIGSKWYIKSLFRGEIV
jgi:hypothetical protein